MEIWATVLSDSLKGGAFWFSPPTQVSYWSYLCRPPFSFWSPKTFRLYIYGRWMFFSSWHLFNYAPCFSMWSNQTWHMFLCCWWQFYSAYMDSYAMAIQQFLEEPQEEQDLHSWLEGTIFTVVYCTWTKPKPTSRLSSFACRSVEVISL
jgi:hypothetical protein